ncbi:MAG: hypothetical protein GXY77_20180 [Fibrobacter sp.]|nr:hypothetical protein [Fibrobacter sp.]
MNSDKSTISYLMLAAACLLLYSGFSMIDQIPSGLKKGNKNIRNEFSPLKSNNFELIERALAYKTNDSSFTYTGDFENPFRNFIQKQKKSSGKSSPLPQRTQLFLKGILIKEKPLAILEDQRGETYIRSIGETVQDQKIISISENRVTLRDLRGTYELSVEGE